MDKLAQQTLMKLIEKHQAGDYESAFLGYQDLLSQHPDSHEIHHILGIYHAQSNQHELAHHHLQTAHTLKPNDIRIEQALATLEKQMGHLKTSIKRLKKITQSHPEQIIAHINLASGLIKNNEHSKADEILNQLLIDDPKIANIYYHKSLIDLHHENNEEALVWLEKTLSLEPEHLLAIKQIAKTLHLLGKNDLAKPYYKTALDQDPNDAELKHCAGVNLLALDDQEAALLYLLEAYALDPKLEDINHNLAAVYLTQGQFKNAVHHWLREHHKSPTTDTFYNIGVSYQYLNRLEDARNYLQEALKRDPSHLGALINLGANALQCFDHPLAINYYQRALTLSPNDQSIIHVLNALQGKQQHQTPTEYTQGLFDQYANHYDEHLTKVLNYQVPTLMLRMINEHTRREKLKILDAGCGTGLMGEVLQPFASHLVGVDLSAKMIDKAREKDIYNKLIQGNITDVQEASFDAIILADVMPYIGDPNELFHWAASQLTANGLLCLSFEDSEEPKWHLQKTARFCHNSDDISDLLVKNHFEIQEILPCKLRKQLGKSLSGKIIAATKKS
jgi:predicted TPR repeat methyltransferase/lipoprotein NlpI